MSSTLNSKERRALLESANAAPAPLVIDFYAWLFLLREKLWVVVVCVLLAVAGAVVYLQVTPPGYTAECIVQVEQDGRVLSSKMEENSEDFKTLEALKTVEGTLSSRTLLVRVAKTNRLLETDPAFKVDAGKAPLKDSDIADIMEVKMDVKLRRGTRLIEIDATDESPERAALLAKSVVDEYMRQSFEQKTESTRLANEALFKQRDQLKARVEKTEQALQEYREKYGVMTLEMQLDGKQTTSLQNVTGEKLKELNKQVQEARIERFKLAGMLPIAEKAVELNIEELLALEPVAKATDVVETQKLLAAKEAEFGDTKKRYLPLHPKYQQVQSQLADIRKSLERAARSAAAKIVVSHEAALQAETKLQEAVSEQERSGVELSRVAIPYNVILRDAQADRALYDQVLTRVREIELAEAVGQVNVRVVQVPEVPVDPTKPRKKLVLALALFAGCVLPVCGIFLVQAFNTTLRSVDEAENALGLPSLAAVPQAEGPAARSRRVLEELPNSREAEAFRTLRTSLALHSDENSSSKALLITSAVPAEGKSYCASNCAVAFAQQGLSTLLIDADLRRPGLGQYFSLDGTQVGLSDILSKAAEFDAACHPSGVEGLTIMPAGTKRTKPGELLARDEFARVLEMAEGKYQKVVIDTAPINAVSDTLLLVDKVGSVVLIVRARKTPTRALQRALRLLEMANSNTAGFVLNRLPPGLANYYYYDEGSYSSAGVYGT